MQQQVLSRSAKGNDMQYTTFYPEGKTSHTWWQGTKNITDTSTTDYKLPSNI